MASDKRQPDPPEEESGSSWHWAYLIPIMALLIPITAITGATMDDLVPILITVAIIGGVWAAGRNLMGYRHQLRMRELDAERDVASLEAQRLREAQQVLDLDDRIQELKRTEEPPNPA